MMRIIYIVTAVVLLGTAFTYLKGVGADPIAPSRAWLETELAKVPTTVGMSPEENSDFSHWQLTIAENPKVWDALIPPPPKKKKAPPKKKPPKKPDMKKMLKGVKIGTAQIGEKIKFTIPGMPDAQWLEVGAKVKGCTLKSFDRQEAVFELNWVQGKKILLHKIPRK
jgi:hypothetical protein